jgi:uncharacterized protein (TIGR02466 family)
MIDTNLIFPIPIWVEDKVGLDTNNLLKFVDRVRSEDPQGRVISNNGGWQSHDFIDEVMQNNPLSELRSKILQMAYYCADEFGFVDYTLRIVNLWMNVNKHGHSNYVHTHPGSILSGVYYLSVPDCCSGTLNFLRDYQYQMMKESWGMGNNVKQDSTLNENIVTFSPLNDHMVMFPSWLLHSVSKSNSDGERISISFNIQVFSNFYHEVYPSRQSSRKDLPLKIV